MVLTGLDAEEIVLDTSSATRFPVSTLGRALEVDARSWLTGVDMTELDSISFSSAVFPVSALDASSAAFLAPCLLTK